MTDRVWMAIEEAVRAGLDDRAVLEAPPRTDEDVIWPAATIADHVCASLPPDVYTAFSTALDPRR